MYLYVSVLFTQATQGKQDKSSLARTIKSQCKDNDGFIHILPKKMLMEDEMNRLAKYEIGSRGTESGTGKVLMVIGETGTGAFISI